MAEAIHFGRFSELPDDEKDDALMLGALGSALRAVERRVELGIADDAYWPTCAINISIQEAQALLAAIPEHRWPMSTRPLRRELQQIVRKGQASRP